MKKVSAIGAPPKLGMEIEANWPSFTSLPAELQKDQTAYNHFRNEAYGKIDEVRRISKDFHEKLPSKYHFPKHWEKGSDAGIEIRFARPADTLTEAESWVEEAVAWLNAMNFEYFTGAGTHVHLGHLAWLNEVFVDGGKAKNKDSDIYLRAEALLFGYFATRENALFEIASPHRRDCGACPPYFTISETFRKNGGLPRLFNATTPLWAIKNHLLTHLAPQWTNGGLTGGCIATRRKNLPTLEFRFFAGTKSRTALLGYLRLLYRMFLNATNVVTLDACRAAEEGDPCDDVLVKPFEYNADSLLKEVSDDPWLASWIKETKANNGNPIETDLDVIRAPEALAAA